MLLASFSLYSMVSGSGPVVLLVLGILSAFALLSWAIIAIKFNLIRKSMVESQDFLDTFFLLPNPTQIYAESERHPNSALARVYRAGYLAAESVAEKGDSSSVRDIRIGRAIKKAANAESKRLSRFVPFLATVGNTGPFIGLFGTVWGIMNSFHTIGLTQSASLASVAPGISEALIATAAGLAAAIPAVMGFNYFTNQIGIIERDMEDFADDFLALCRAHQL
ncbi:MotA/TolQ/ExbB proton channel family protein [Chlorobium limicola]